MRTYVSLGFIALLGLCAAGVFAQRGAVHHVHFPDYDFSEPLPPGFVRAFRLSEPPVRGTVLVNGIRVGSNPVELGSGVTYLASDPALFSANSLANVSVCHAFGSFYDTFELQEVVYGPGVSTQFRAIESVVCAIDVPDAPSLNSTNVVVGFEPVPFRLEVADLDDGVLGELDNLPSVATFSLPNGSLAIHSGVVFSSTTLPIGRITDCGPSPETVASRVLVPSVDFCFDPSAENGELIEGVHGVYSVQVFAVDASGLAGSPANLTFSTATLGACPGPGVWGEASPPQCQFTLEENLLQAGNESAQTNFVEFSLFGESFSRVQAEIYLVIERLPKRGFLRVSYDVLLVEPGLTRTERVDAVAGVDVEYPANATFRYEPYLGYYNRLRYRLGIGNQTSHTFASGEPIRSECPGQAQCPDYLEYSVRLLIPANASVVAPEVELRSPRGATFFFVDRELSDQPRICHEPSPAYLGNSFIEATRAPTRAPTGPGEPAPLESNVCDAAGEMGSDIPVFLTGTGGERNSEYHVRVISLPRFGALFLNVGTSTPQRGARVSAGDIIRSTPDPLRPFFLYAASGDFHGAFLYDSSPDETYSPVDQWGHLPPLCAEGIFCADTFAVRALSPKNESLVSLTGYVRVNVAKRVEDQLSVCHVLAPSPWNFSCVSIGVESNELYGDYYTPLFLNAQNVGEEALNFSYVVTELPQRGSLFINNSTNPSELSVGPPVLVNMPFEPRPADEATLIYLGVPDYFNRLHEMDASGEFMEDGDVVYQDAHDVPFGNELCLSRTPDQGSGWLPNGPELPAESEVPFAGSCPDVFKFYASTPDGRRSNLGKYEIYVNGLISPSEFSGPEELQYRVGERLNFTGDDRVTYTDPDGDAYPVELQIAVIDGRVGSLGDSGNLSFPGGANAPECLNTTGCEGSVLLVGLPSDIQRFVDELFFESDVAINATEGTFLYITVFKRLPNGVTEHNRFLMKDDDVPVFLDVFLYSSGGGLLDLLDENPHLEEMAEMAEVSEILERLNMTCLDENCTLETLHHTQAVEIETLQTSASRDKSTILALSIALGVVGGMALVGSALTWWFWPRRGDLLASRQRHRVDSTSTASTSASRSSAWEAGTGGFTQPIKRRMYEVQ